MWAVYSGDWWDPKIIRIFRRKEDAEKGRIFLAYQLAQERAITFLDEIGESLDKLGITEIKPEMPPYDKDVLDILIEATTTAFKEGLEEGAIGNLCTLLESMAELYDPDTLLQKIAEGVEKYRYKDKDRDRDKERRESIQILHESFEKFLSEIGKTLELPEAKVKQALLTVLV